MKKKLSIFFLIIGIIFVFLGVFIFFKFSDVTIEFGENSVDSKQFARYGKKDNYKIDYQDVDYNKIGRYSVLITYYGLTVHKNLNIVDTTPPILETQDVYEKINYQINADDFIVNKEDKNEITVSFDTNADTTKYGEYKVKIIASDTSGNKTERENMLYISWTKLDYELEVGDILKISDLVFKNEDKNTIEQSEIDKINNSREGNYIVKTVKDGVELEINIIKHEDKTPPVLELKKVTIYEGKKTNGVNDFVSKSYDKGGKVSLKLLTDINYSKIGEQKIKVEAKDENNNVTTKETTLKIIKDTKGPNIKGLSKLSVKKNSKIDFLKGVSAHDDNFGACDVSVDTSKVNLSKYGTYHAVYTSSDKLGNKTTSKRVIFVEHDKSDTDALVKEVAKTLSSNVESIRDYVRNKIKYSKNAGGSDPIWYGLTNKVGDCHVHAYVFDALLKAKGYTTKIICVKDKTHYWIMIYLNGKWVHMDSTPGVLHTKYSIMNDEQRYEILQGRDWDRSLWPKAE